MNRLRKGPTQGYTLLEIILALSLAAVVMLMIATVLHVQARVIDSGRSGLDDARLAHSILKNIGDDVVGVIRYEPVDEEGLKSISLANLIAAQKLTAAQNLAAATAANGSTTSGVTSAGTETGQGSSGASSNASATSPGSSSSAAGATTDASSATTPQPGLVGEETWMKIDVSRLPRLDEYGGTGKEDGSPVMPPCDVRTICYELQTLPGGPSGGLMKSETHRAAAIYADANGDTNHLGSNARLIASEVRSIRFSYFDGGAWSSCWPPTTSDASQSSPGLPLAVQITLEIPAGAGAGKANEQDLRTYAMVVKLESGGSVAQVTAASDSSSTNSQPSSNSENSSPDSSASSGSANGTGSQNTPGNGRGGPGSANGPPGRGGGLPGGGSGAPGRGTNGAGGGGPGSQTFTPAGGAGVVQPQQPIKGGGVN